MRSTFTVNHNEHVSSRPFEEVVSTFESGVGSVEDTGFSALLARKGAPVEADHILGDFIERGCAHGVSTPLLKAALVNLRVYQDRLAKG